MKHGAVVAKSTVGHAVARIRRGLVITPAGVAVPQTHVPGGEAEVDFGEFQAVIGGTQVKLFMLGLENQCSGESR
ncbi:UNVERIFIED_ORG: hypothetical protein ABIB52_001813 [Arthrobacter sp. UYCu721]